jgi:hypothetical protein
LRGAIPQKSKNIFRTANKTAVFFVIVIRRAR